METMLDAKNPYEKPQVILDTAMEAQAGSPLSLPGVWSPEDPIE